MGSVVSRESVPRKSVWRRSVSVRSVSRAVRWAVPSRRRRVRQRLGALVGAVDGVDVSGMSVEELLGRVDRYLCDPTPAKMWITLAVLTARLPREADVVEAIRRHRLFGPLCTIEALLRGSGAWLVPAVDRRVVEVVTAGTLVDVDHTSTVAFATGIQRVVRETVKRWVRDHDPILVGWTSDRSALRRLDPSEIGVVIGGPAGQHSLRRTAGSVIIPFGASYVLPELNTSEESMRRLASLARWSGGRATSIGFDAVPVTSPETTDPGMPAAFANTLGAVAWMDGVAAISAAAAVEYRGWCRMLEGAGITGPDIVAIPLGQERPEQRPSIPSGIEPKVLCVGSHEPRKNHLAVLHAAEVLWAEGLEFQLDFVGGNAWQSEAFVRRVDELVDRGRHIKRHTAVGDDELDEMYRRARFSVFPSLNEGYGLPIVESLIRLTPVITSDFGSLQEVASAGGALRVDPRDDVAIADAMRRLLTNDALREELSAEAAARSWPTWDEYAREVWTFAHRDRRAVQ